MSLPYFTCSPYTCTLLVSLCAKRYREAQEDPTRPQSSGSGPAHNLQRSHCRECAVGEKHAAGIHARLWPDGKPIVRLRVLERGDGLQPGTLSREERARREKIAAQLRAGRESNKKRAAVRAAGRK